MLCRTAQGTVATAMRRPVSVPKSSIHGLRIYWAPVEGPTLPSEETMNATAPDSPVRHRLGLHAGDWVEVRSEGEILSTLDERGCLDSLPFMPEMLQFCGQRFRVFKSAHKTCDVIIESVNRRMSNAVHLEGLRCDGQAHGGCQQRCLLFWKEAWLKPVPGREPSPAPAAGASAAARFDRNALQRATRGAAGSDGEERYACQATEIVRATTLLRWWDPRPYVQDLLSRNIGLVDFLRFVLIATYNAAVRRLGIGRTYPYLRGLATDQTPSVNLNLQPGDLVQVRSKEEIMLTINKRFRNKGLSFDVEMVPYCGRTFRVLSRVERLIDDKTGKMLRPSRACLILEGVVCGGCLSKNRLFCPRSIYYWHEVWLKRVELRTRIAAGFGQAVLAWLWSPRWRAGRCPRRTPRPQAVGVDRTSVRAAGSQSSPATPATLPTRRAGAPSISPARTPGTTSRIGA
jgi:hypothetical protein